MEGIAFAQIIVKQQQEERVALTMKQEDAQFAEKSFPQISTQTKSSVPESAAIYYVGIKETKFLGKQPVYNMEVDDYHNFSVNGGIIVHNCMDATRYFAYTVMRREVRARGL